jgi:hypothetical protein
MNTAQLMARLDPDYQMRLQKVQQASELAYFKANTDMQRERYRAEREDQRESIRSQTALSVENKRGDNALTLADKEHQNKFSQMQYLSEREDQRETMRGETALALSDKDHQNQLTRMQTDLQNRLTLAGFDSGVLATHKMMDEDNNRRASMLAQMENRTQLRGEVFKMLAGAIVQEKLAQKQHARDLEKMNLASNLKQGEQYFESVCLYLAKLLDASREEEAKAEIDRLFKEWGAVEV